jgi:hypothetical protein
MDEKKSKYSKISKIGPMFKLEGGLIFKHPFKSYPLEGFDNANAFRNSEPFLNSISDMASDWFERFPNCCDAHREIEQLGNFEYIPSQILNNVKYFAHALETLIDEENGINEIKDYLDYLIESFGRPDIGGHIFDRVVKHFIENGTIDNKEFTDDQRLELLEHFEPTKPPIDLNERDLDTLYLVFQKWLEAMPNIGRFKELKERLKGKIPMNIFLIEPKFNKYLGLSSFKARSRKELLEFLIKMTNDILNLSRHEIKKENYDKDKLIVAAEERLRVKQDKLLQINNSDLEINYLNLVENWLSIVIEFYQVISQSIEESKSSKLIDSVSGVKTNLNDILTKLDELQIEIASLCNSNKILHWLKSYLPEDSFKHLMNEIENLDEDKEDGKRILDSMISQLQSSGIDDFKINGIEKKAKSPDLAIKHKLKLTIPLFLFTKYEGEIELSDKQKLPKSLKELKKLLFE